MRFVRITGKRAGANFRLADFTCKKTTQSLNYLIQKSDNKMLDKYVLLKLFWAGDRYHLRKYSRLIVDESYVAMENGPVGSLAKDIIYAKTEYGLPEECLPYTSSYIEKVSDNVHSLKNTDESYLSPTDKEALDFAWETLGHMTKQEIIDFTHKYPEWDRHGSDLSEEVKSKNIDIRDFYKEPGDTQNDPFAIDPELKEISEEQFEESLEIKALLRR